MDDYAEEKDVYAMGVKDFERVGGSSILSDLLTNPNLASGKIKMTGENVSDEDRFLVFTNAFCRDLDVEADVKLTETDINMILEKTRLVPNLKYKNYVAYVLGYIASEGGRSLDKVNYVIDTVLPKLDDKGSVEPPDVVRYASLWMKI